jgi:hypothetical protein
MNQKYLFFVYYLKGLISLSLFYIGCNHFKKNKRNETTTTTTKENVFVLFKLMTSMITTQKYN